jgi:hypothetical protein
MWSVYSHILYIKAISSFDSFWNSCLTHDLKYLKVQQESENMIKPWLFVIILLYTHTHTIFVKDRAPIKIMSFMNDIKGNKDLI